MRGARTALVLALTPLLAVAPPWLAEAQTREQEGAVTNTLACADNPCFGADGDDTIFGTDGHEQIRASQGGDRLSGFDGSDVIAGDDELQEDRFLSPGPGSATLTDGNDDIDAGPGDDGPVVGFGGSDVLLGGDGNDTLDAREFSQRLGNDFVGGGPGNDSITAEDRAYDEIDCGEGEDTVSGFDYGLDAVSYDCENVFPSGRLVTARSPTAPGS